MLSTRLLLAALALAPSLVGATAVHASGAARISMRPSVTVARADVVLADVADVEAADPALRQRLESLVIATAPRQAYTETLTREQIAAQVRKVVGDDATEWDGSSATRIRGRGQHLATERLADAAVRALHRALAGQYSTIALQPVGNSAGISVPVGEVRLDARVPEGQLLARRMSALVDVRVDGQVYTTVPVWFAVRATRDALVARAPLPSGEPLRSEDFSVRSIEVTTLSAPALAADTALDGLRLRHRLEPGGALAAAQIEARPQVTRAARVAVQVVQGTVTIDTIGVAMADARIGEVVKVRNPRSQEAFSARVVGDGVVMVGGR